MPAPAPASLLQTLGWGVHGRCPRCGQGGLFKGFLAIGERCAVCGLGFGGHDAGDGPAVFAIFILSFGVVGLAGFIEFLFAPPLWLHVVLWLPITLGFGLFLLRPLKGLTIAIQYRVRSVEEQERPGAT